MQQYSSYFQELDNTTKQQYKDKMRKIGVLVDPYLLQESSGTGTVEWQLRLGHVLSILMCIIILSRRLL